MGERIARESETLPYRWGYFQGALLIPWSLWIIFGTASELQKPGHEAWYFTAVGFLIGLLGLPLAFGLLRKRRFALVLVYAMFGLSLLLVAMKIPVIVRHYTNPGDNGSASAEAELLLMWLLSLLYYRKRRAHFQ